MAEEVCGTTMLWLREPAVQSMHLQVTITVVNSCCMVESNSHDPSGQIKPFERNMDT